jgi:hypothetical protein
MAQAQSLTGRFGNALVASVSIPVTGWEVTTNKNLADSTDSSCYDSASGQTWNAQQPGTIGLELTLKGNYDLATTSANISAKLRLDGPFPLVLGLTQSINYCSGNFDFENVQTSLEVPGGTMVTWSCSAKSNGPITYY